MNDAFDDGFTKMSNWLGQQQGDHPVPSPSFDDNQRIDWWRGYSKAIEYSKKFNKLEAKMEAVKIAMIEDLALFVIYSLTCLAGLWFISSWDWPMLIGIPLVVYGTKNLIKIGKI